MAKLCLQCLGRVYCQVDSESRAQNVLASFSQHHGYCWPVWVGKKHGAALSAVSARSGILALGGARLSFVDIGSHNSLPQCKCTVMQEHPSSFLLQSFDDFIFAFFAVEMIVKMIALGIFGKKCYLGDTWNRLDFFIVIAG